MKAQRPKPTRHAEKIEHLVDSVLNGPGHSDPQLRRAVEQRAAAHAGRLPENGVQLPPEIGIYVDKLALHAFKITDADVEALCETGYSEDEIFELTLSAALGAGLARLEFGMAALAGGQDAA